MDNTISSLDYNDLLLSIEENRVELDNNYRVINDGLRAITTLNNMSKLNEMSLENKSISNEMLSIVLDTLNTSLEAIGCDIIKLDDSVSLEDNVKDLNITLEGIGADIWLAIKKVFENIMSIFGKYYNNIRNFFKVTDVRVDELKKKLNDAPDLNEFDIESGSQQSLVDYCKKNLKLFNALSLDLLNINDLNNYTDSVTSNNWLFDNTQLIFKGKDSPTKEIQFPGKFGIIKSNFKDIFNNLDSATSKRNDPKINSMYVINIKTNKATLMSLIKDGDNVSISSIDMNVDDKYVDNKHKAKLSKLDKNKITVLIEDLIKIRTKEEQYIKAHEIFMDKVKLEYKSLSEKELATEAFIVSNTNAAANISSSILSSLTNHVNVYSAVSEKLVDIYVKASKKAK